MATTKNPVIHEKRVGRPSLDPALFDRVIELYNEGYSYRGIQRFTPLSLRTISDYINANKDKLTREQYNGGRNTNHREIERNEK